MKTFLSAMMVLAFAWMATAQAEERMDLSGIWQFQLDITGFGKTPGSELYKKNLHDLIMLPGTTDLAGKGIANPARHVDRLTRRFEYMGAAWYRKKVVIPDHWRDKEITMVLERCHWETSVYVDGVPAGTDERLSTPNRFVLTDKLPPGEHDITLCVDNRLKYPMDHWNHGTTEYTQTNWNGIVGEILLVAEHRVRIASLKVSPDVGQHGVKLEADIVNNGNGALQGTWSYLIREKGGRMVVSGSAPLTLEAGKRTQAVAELDLGTDVRLWDEFHPDLYEVEVALDAGGMQSRKSSVFGMRDVARGEHHILVNGHRVHLRGALDCAVFPLTGHPAMERGAWDAIFRTVREYGLNHVRFHSWCPPRAAFEAADKAGLYLQVELPMWIKDVGKHPERRDFFEREMLAILDEYGNHPSFVLMCNGNENEGDFAVLEDLINKARAHDGRRLYSASTARTHVKADDYYVSHVSAKGGITVYEGTPSTLWDKSAESDVDVPVIAHETGQRCMYPDFREMKKYTGVLEARNLEVYRERLEANGMLAQAEDFFRATGAHTVLQYKEVNEALLRTPNSGGFQLLGLADFPGQGCAFVGILDAFWESKGLVAPETWRESCAPTVLLCRLAQRVFDTSDTLEARIDIYHYGEHPLPAGELQWSLATETGETVAQGRVDVQAVPRATVMPLGSVKVPLNGITRPEQLVLKVSLGKDLSNSWKIWVYPQTAPQPGGESVTLLREWGEPARKALEQGKAVLLIPRDAMGRKTRFAGHFWNPVMFNWDPMIVGTLIDAKHAAFGLFPTGCDADWQWWDILNHSRALDLTACRGLTPVIQSIDSYEHNRKLGIAFETRVGKGRLFVLCTDIDHDMDKRPATRQLLHSVRAYVAGEKFMPSHSIEAAQLDLLFATGATDSAQHAKEGEAAKQLLNK